MPQITAIASPYASLKRRPLSNKQLDPSEIIKVPKTQKLGVVFPYKDSAQPVQAVRLVGNATNLGLKAGEILYAYHKEWVVNDGLWVLQSVQKNEPSILDWFFKKNKKYTPKMKPGDYHLVVIDDERDQFSSMVAYNHKEERVWKKDCLARGQNSDWGVYAGDTPTGLYKLGQCWIADRSDEGTCKPYGIHCFDLESIEDGEDSVGRAGICLHGGGSALGYTGCIDDYQQLVPTFGCIRMYNADLRDVIYPLWMETVKPGTNNIYVSVYQIN